MSARVYLTVTIDTECDKGAKWRVKRPLAFEGVTRGVALHLQPLFRAHRAKATYLLSPEVMRHEPSIAALRAVEAEAELGTHLHGELAEPGAFEPDETKAFQRDYPEEVERDKLVYLTRVFREAFGRAPRSFRAGRFGVGPATLGILEDLGYAVESSVTPFMDWAPNGAPGLAFLDAPTQPYHPDRRDPGRRGSSPLWEVPVTILPHPLGALPLLGGRLEPRWLRPTRGTERGITRVAADAIARARAEAPGRPVVLTCMFHNVEILPGTSPYAETEGQALAILRRLRALLSFAEREGIAVIGLADVPEVLEA